MSTQPLTFEEALVEAQFLVERYASDPAVLPEIADLLQSPAGARGFFVVFLTGNHPIDAPDLLSVLRQAPDPVPELLVKNLVMATAMTIAHTDPEKIAGSQQVAQRTHALLQHLPHCQPVIQQMYLSLTETSGPYSDFLTKWGYNEDQKRLMAMALADLV